MAQIFSKSGDVTIVSHKKMTHQGKSARTKYCQRGRRPRRKPYRGQGR